MATQVQEGTAASAKGSSLSIVICTKDRHTELTRAIASVRASGEAGMKAEIVLVEEGDAPRTIDGVRYVYLPREGLGFGYARNVGLRHAQGEIILFIDDDCEAAPGWGEALIEPFHRDPAVLGVAGAVLVHECNLIGYAENILGFPGGGLRYLHRANGHVVPTRFLSTCNCAYRRESVLKTGGFPEDTRLGAEDSLVAERISAMGRCVYAPDAVVYHRTRGHLGAIFRWFVRRGQSEIDFFQKTATPWTSLRYLLRSSLGVRLVVLLIFLIHSPWLGTFIPAGVLGYYAVLLWRFRYARAYPSHRTAWWIVPVVKMMMDIGMEVGRWKALVRRRSACTL